MSGHLQNSSGTFIHSIIENSDNPHEMLVISSTRISIGDPFIPYSAAFMNYSVNPVSGDKHCML